ncbi:hypothetical protein INT45_012089 [Circinella minor]|uniref:Uncharacterized protein n=1 Tax=Circinella minor TaxID=1195481 RepID=A0A8H7RJ78_9FUNG|nr:hypothetical protein INT45_012089 [Circinella minor]
MPNENNSNAASSCNRKHCTCEQYEVMLRIIEVPENFECLCGIHKSSVPTNDNRKTRKTEIYALMAQKVGAGWTTASAKSRFETWFHNFKKVFCLCGDNGVGITYSDRRKGIQTIEAKKESMCYGYMRLKALYQDRENVNPSYHEESGAAPPSLFRYASTLAPQTSQHESSVTDLADNGDQMTNENSYSGSDEPPVSDSVQGAGSQEVQTHDHEYEHDIPAYHNDGSDDGGNDDGDDDGDDGGDVDGNVDDDVNDDEGDDEDGVKDNFEDDVEDDSGDGDEEGEEDEDQDVGRMPKRHGNFTAAYDDQGIKRLKFEKIHMKFKKEKHAAEMQLARKKPELQRAILFKKADNRELAIRMKFIQKLLIKNYTSDEAEELWTRFSNTM